MHHTCVTGQQLIGMTDLPPKAGMLATFAPRSRTSRCVRFSGRTAQYSTYMNPYAGQQFLKRPNLTQPSPDRPIHLGRVT